jgi:hypothetical protein
MKTDIPLRVLTAISAADLLPLLGIQEAEVLGVDSLEMPSMTVRLDTVLRLRLPNDRTSLHLVEWQGWRDPNFLWRVIEYLGWLGQHRHERPINATPVYLWPEADVGDSVQHVGDNGANWSASFRCVRLWQEDAQAAVQSGRPGLAALSPLMRGATTLLVEEALQVVANAAMERQAQTDLMSILGLLAEPLLTSARLEAVVGRERLMTSKLVEYLYKEEFDEYRNQIALLTQELQQERERERERERLLAERERERERLLAEQERERAERERERARLMNALVQAIEAEISSRFPDARLSVGISLRQIQDPGRLSDLLGLVLRAPDLSTIEQALAAES